MANTVSATMWRSKAVAVSMGVVFLIVGLLAFIDNPIVGPRGFFLTDRAHDTVHLLTGILLIISGYMWELPALRAIQTAGIVYGIIFILGLFMGNGELLWFIAMNSNDHWLHLVLTAVLLYFGYWYLDRRNR